MESIKNYRLSVKVEAYNPGQPTQHFGLVRTERSADGKHIEKIPLQYAPYWKTRAGAERYAKKQGYNLQGAKSKSTAKKPTAKRTPAKKSAKKK